MNNSSRPSFEQFVLIIEDKLKIPREQVQPETVLKDVEIDSIAVIEVVLAAEKRFGTSISMDDVDVDGRPKTYTSLWSRPSASARHDRSRSALRRRPGPPTHTPRPVPGCWPASACW